MEIKCTPGELISLVIANRTLSGNSIATIITNSFDNAKSISKARLESLLDGTNEKRT